jgi:glycosyltransferase involved in cell wall biosynthesis
MSGRDRRGGDAGAASEIRVCHLLHHLALGGVENQLLRLVEAMGEYPVSHTVCYFGDDDSLLEEMEGAGADVRRLETTGPTAADQFDPRSLLRLWQFLREGSFDVLHTHVSLYVPVVGRVCGRLSGTPVVGTYHNTRETYHPGTKVLECATRPLSAVDIAVSKDVERSYAGSAAFYNPGAGGSLGRETYTIHNGIDVDEFASQVDSATPENRHEGPDDGDGIVFLSVGRYAEEKNQQSLVAAMADVVEALPSSHLFLVGWGPLEADLRGAVVRHGIEESVTVTGRVESVQEYYSLADVFVLPSLTEGLSVVLLEAMAAGLPVVGTDVPGTAEAVDDGSTGVVVPPDSPEALADAMVRVAPADRRERMGRNGHQRVREHFSIRHTAESYVDIYRRVCPE